VSSLYYKQTAVNRDGYGALPVFILSSTHCFTKNQQLKAKITKDLSGNKR